MIYEQGWGVYGILTIVLINKGNNQLSTIYIIAARLGDSVAMVLETYGHMFPSSQKDIIDRLNFDF